MTSQYRHRRTSTPATPFPTLEPGEIAVNTANRQISVGDAATPTLGTPKPLLAIRFFDSAAIYAIGDIVTNAGQIWRAIAINGPGAFNAAQWEPAASQVTIASNPPSNAVAGSMWWDSDNGMLYVRYNDGDSSQWVQATAMPVVDTTAFVLKAGDTMTGDLKISKSIPILTLDDTGGVVSDLRFYRNGGRRWFLRMAGDTETGSNVGSSLQVVGYADDGVTVIAGAPALMFSRSDSRIDVAGDPIRPLNIAPKQYVDARAGDAMAYSGMQINGSMDVSQELGTNTVVVTNSSRYALDGFGAAFLGTGSVSVGQTAITSLAGFPFCVQMNCGVANTMPGGSDGAWLYQTFEGYRWQRMAYGTAGARPVTIGFWVFPQIAGTMAVSVRGANLRSYVVDVTVTANSWQYKTVTVPGCTDGTWNNLNGASATVSFCFGAVGTRRGAAANTWLTTDSVASPATTNFFSAPAIIYLTGVVVLPGAQAPTAAQSPLLMRPYDQELVTCHRYYDMGITSLDAHPPGGSVAASVRVQYKTQMRAQPTIKQTNTQNSNCAATCNAVDVQGDSFKSYRVSTAGGPMSYTEYWFADARL